MLETASYGVHATTAVSTLRCAQESGFGIQAKQAEMGAARQFNPTALCVTWATC